MIQKFSLKISSRHLEWSFHIQTDVFSIVYFLVQVWKQWKKLFFRESFPWNLPRQKWNRMMTILPETTLPKVRQFFSQFPMRFKKKLFIQNFSLKKFLWTPRIEFLHPNELFFRKCKLFRSKSENIYKSTFRWNILFFVTNYLRTQKLFFQWPCRTK